MGLAARGNAPARTEAEPLKRAVRSAVSRTTKATDVMDGIGGISLRRHDPDQVRRVFRGSGTLSRLLTTPRTWKHCAREHGLGQVRSFGV